MKESRFIELLNLYVDHQLSSSEAAELEAEISRNAGRRQTYEQYCRMQKACALLFEKERAQAPASRKLAAAVFDADRKIIGFPSGRSNWSRSLYPVLAAAAAACVAVVFVRRDHGRSAIPDTSPVVASSPAPSVSSPEQPVAIELTKASPAKARPEYFPVFTTRRLSSDRQSASVDTLTAEVPRDALASYAWMREVEMAPVPTLVSERITLKNSNGAAEDRILRSPKPVQGATEMSAFQFQR